MRRSRYSAAFALALLLAGCGNVETDRVEWTVMGTVAALQTRGEHIGRDGSSPAALAAAMGVAKDVEAKLNAHSPSSELSGLAAFGEDWILAHCDAAPGGLVRTRPCYEAAFRLAKASGGAFNPRWRGEGTLDLGAIAKGFAADAAADAAAEHLRGGAVDTLLDIGGNLKALRGVWRTGVKDPGGRGFAATVELREGEALATSATYYRGGHIFDGRTGKPVANGVASVTVLCSSAMWADGLSTTLFVLGPEEGTRFISSRFPDLAGGIPASALWILDDGRQVRCDPDNRFLRTGAGRH